MARPVSVPFIPAMETTECGAACLAMILAKYGHWAPQQEVRDACGISREGTSAQNIVSAAHSYGMEAEAVLADLSEFKELQCPCILHVDFAHFLIMRGHNRRKVWVTDPALGDLTLDMKIFARRYTGVAIVMVPGETFQFRHRSISPLGRIPALLKGAGPYLLGVAWLTAIAQAFGMAIPFLDRFMIDRVIPAANHVALFWVAVIGLGAFTFMAFSEAVRGLILREMRTRLDLTMMRDLMEQLFRMPVAFFLQRAQGALAQKALIASSVRSTVSEQVVVALFDAATALAFTVVLAQYTLLGAGVALIFAGCFSLAQRSLTQRLQSLYMSKVAASGAAYSVLMESQHAIETVKAMGAEGRILDLWCAHAIAEARDEVKIGSVRASHQVGLQMMGETFIMVVVGLAGSAFAKGRMTAGEFAAVLVAARSITQAVTSFSGAFQSLGHVGGQLNALGDIMDAIPERSGGVRPESMTGGVRLEALTFSYGRFSPNVVQEVDLEIAPGEMIGIVGPSGSGKTTLVKLMAGLFTPNSGRILMDGIAIEQFDLTWLRARIGFVLQESFVFNDSIAFNVTLGAGFDLEKFERVCHCAGLTEVLRALPQGYATIVGEGGRLLSGGQRQRLNLARALYKEPSILILDEASSALDLETEQQIHQALVDLACTRIVIAHRLETVKAASRIVMIEEGRLVAAGSFDHLVATNERFHAMCVASGALSGGEA